MTKFHERWDGKLCTYKWVSDLLPIIMRLQIYSMKVHQRSGGRVPSGLVFKPLKPNLMFDIGANHIAKHAAPIFIRFWPMLRQLLHGDWSQFVGIYQCWQQMYVLRILKHVFVQRNSSTLSRCFVTAVAKNCEGPLWKVCSSSSRPPAWGIPWFLIFKTLWQSGRIVQYVNF